MRALGGAQYAMRVCSLRVMRYRFPGVRSEGRGVRLFSRHGEGATHLHLRQLRRPAAEVARAVSRLRRLEHPDRIRCDAEAHRTGAARGPGRGHASRPHRRQHRRAPPDGPRRARSCARRWSRSRQRRLDRWRARYRQVDVAAARPRQSRLADSNLLCHGRRVARASRTPSAAPRRCGGAARYAGRDVRRGRARQRHFTRQARRAGHRFDPNAVQRGTAIRSRLRESGARLRCTAHAVRKIAQRGDAADRSCHEGGHARRSARLGTHGRYGAVLRKRRRQPVPNRSDRQEPLRRRE